MCRFFDVASHPVQQHLWFQLWSGREGTRGGGGPGPPWAASAAQAGVCAEYAILLNALVVVHGGTSAPAAGDYVLRHQAHAGSTGLRSGIALVFELGMEQGGKCCGQCQVMQWLARAYMRLHVVGKAFSMIVDV